PTGVCAGGGARCNRRATMAAVHASFEAVRHPRIDEPADEVIRRRIGRRPEGGVDRRWWRIEQIVHARGEGRLAVCGAEGIARMEIPAVVGVDAPPDALVVRAEGPFADQAVLGIPAFLEAADESGI